MLSRSGIGLTLILATTWVANSNSGEVITYKFFVPERNLLIVNGECYTGEVKLEYRSADSTLVVNDTQIVRKPPRDKSVVEWERKQRLSVDSVKSAVDLGADPDQIIAETKHRESAFRVEMYRILDDDDAPVDLEQRLADLLDEFSDVVAELGIPEPGGEVPSRAYYRLHWWDGRVEVAPKYEPGPSLLEHWNNRLNRVGKHLAREHDDIRFYVVLLYTRTSFGTSQDPDFEEVIQSAIAERY